MTLSVGQRAVVVDASLVVPVLQGDTIGTRLWQGWVEDGAIVLGPPHLPAEVGNALLRSARLKAADVDVRLEQLSRLGLEIADRGISGLRRAVQLADQHGLSVYDAMYLELAIDVDGELATRDRDLARAAAAEGVIVESLAGRTGL